MPIDRRTLVAVTAAMLGASACRAGEPARASVGPARLALLGQQGHGKTTLAAALARARPGAHELIDRPGAPAAVPAVIEGLWAADAAVLLVSAADGPMPQTREHILLARQMRVENLVVFLSKADLNDDAELLELIELETRDLLSAYQLAGDEVTVVTGSAKLALEGGTGETGQPSMQKLLTSIDALPASRRRQTKSEASAQRFSAETYILTPEEDGLRGPAPENWPVQLFFESGLSGSAVIRAEPGAGPIQPGENRAVIVELEAAAPVEQVTRFAIRGEGRTLGAGVVTGVI